MCLTSLYFTEVGACPDEQITAKPYNIRQNIYIIQNKVKAKKVIANL